MLRTFIPRVFVYSFMVITVINLGLVHRFPSVPDNAEARQRLLDWRDPETGTSLGLYINPNTDPRAQYQQFMVITNLNLYNDNLTELPPEIELLTNLEILNLNNNQLTDLPPEIGNLHQLKVLNLDSNLLTELPPEICTLHSLE